MISNELLKKKILDAAFTGQLIKNQVTFEKSKYCPILKHWNWMKLKDIAKIVNGFTPLRSEKKFWNKNEINWFTIEDIREQGQYINHTKQYITSEALGKSSDRLLPPKTVLICCTASVGEVAISEISLTTNQQFNGLVIKDEYKDVIDPYYLFHYSKTLKDKLILKAGKTTINFVSTKKLGELIIPIPSIEEQKKIVKKIEELFALIDKKERNDNEKEKLKTLLKEKILDSAIRGELVENDSSLPAIDVEETKDNILFEIPNNWKWSCIEKCVQINPKNKIDDEMDTGFIPMSNIDGGYRDNAVFETKKWKNIKKGFSHFKNDDVIVAKITPCFENRKSAYINNLPSGYGAGTTEIHVLRNIDNKMYMKYLLWFVKTNYFIKDGKNHFTGTAGQQRVSKQWLSKILIPIPPLKQQKKIVDKIEKCFELIEQL